MKKAIITALLLLLLVGLFIWKPWKGTSDSTGAGTNGIPSAAQAAENRIAELQAQLAASKAQPTPPVVQPQAVIVPDGQPGVVVHRDGRAVVTKTMNPTPNFGGHHTIEFKLTGARKDPKRVPGFDAWVRSFRDRANKMLVNGASSDQVNQVMLQEYARFGIGGQPSLVIN